MNEGGVCRTAVATPGMLNIDILVGCNPHNISLIPVFTQAASWRVESQSPDVCLGICLCEPSHLRHV